MPATAFSSLAKVLRLTPENVPEAIETAASVLLRGGVVALPTDTLYGVSTLIPYSDKLYELKRRSNQKPLGLFVACPADIGHWAQQTISPATAHQLLPGPVTLLFERKPALPAAFNPGVANVGIRVPDSQFVQALCARVGQPLAQSSANVSGSAFNPVSVDDFRDILPQIDLVLDGGIISRDHPEGSTVVDLSIRGGYRILRDGCARKDTEKLLTEAGLESL